MYRYLKYPDNQVVFLVRPCHILVLIGTLAVISAVSAVPPLPSELFGSLTINGAPAPAGLTIIAKIGDQQKGVIVTTKSGAYGGPGSFDDHLVVTGEEGDVDKVITFWIGNVQAAETGKFSPGSAEALNLTFSGVDLSSVPTAIPTTQPTSPGISGGGSSSGGSSGSSSPSGGLTGAAVTSSQPTAVSTPPSAPGGTAPVTGVPQTTPKGAAVTQPEGSQVIPTKQAGVSAGETPAPTATTKKAGMVPFGALIATALASAILAARRS